MYSRPRLFSAAFLPFAQAGDEAPPAVAHDAEDGEHVVGGAEAAGWDVALGEVSKVGRKELLRWSMKERGRER